MAEVLGIHGTRKIRLASCDMPSFDAIPIIREWDAECPVVAVGRNQCTVILPDGKLLAVPL